MMRKKNLMELKTLKETQFLLEAIREKERLGPKLLWLRLCLCRNEEKSSVQENDEDVIFGQYITLEVKKIQDQRKKSFN